MEFFAFPVHMGDSFLLKDKKFNLLVDGGDGKEHILPHLLKQLGPEPLLNVVICSHFDRDHIDGLLDFFQHLIDQYVSGDNPSVEIDEVWLPDIFARIEMTKREDIRSIIVPKDAPKDFRDRETSIKVEMKDGTEDDLTRNKDEFDVAIYRICRIVRTCFAMKRFEIIKKIRWFELQDSYKNQIVHGTNVYGINCLEITRAIMPCSTDKELRLNYTRINEDSLVFRYNSGDDNISPNVLFTADSNFFFCEGITPDIVEFNSDKTIVTTPHHGSNDDEHIKVYTNLGRLPRKYIFVRSSEIHKSRPCCEYVLNRPDIYCVRCKKDEGQPVHLIYCSSSGRWKADPLMKVCTCIPVPR